MSWYFTQPNNTQSNNQKQKKQTKPLRSQRLWLQRNTSMEIVFLNNLCDLSNIKWVYEHLYHERLKDNNGNYTLEEKALNFQFCTCLADNPDGLGCPFCDYGSKPIKTGYTTVLAHKISSKGNEYYVRIPFAIKSKALENFMFIFSSLETKNTKHCRFKLHRTGERNAPSSGNMLQFLKQHTEEEMKNWKIYDCAGYNQDFLKPYNMAKVLKPLDRQVIIDAINSGRFIVLRNQINNNDYN